MGSPVRRAAQHRTTDATQADVDDVAADADTTTAPQSVESQQGEGEEIDPAVISLLEVSALGNC